MFKEEASQCGTDKFARRKEGWCSQSNSGLGAGGAVVVKEMKEKGKEKARLFQRIDSKGHKSRFDVRELGWRAF